MRGLGTRPAHLGSNLLNNVSTSVESVQSSVGMQRVRDSESEGRECSSQSLT